MMFVLLISFAFARGDGCDDHCNGELEKCVARCSSDSECVRECVRESDKCFTLCQKSSFVLLAGEKTPTQINFFLGTGFTFLSLCHTTH